MEGFLNLSEMEIAEDSPPGPTTGQLSLMESDVDLIISEDRLTAETIPRGAFCAMWSGKRGCEKSLHPNTGARTTIGISAVPGLSAYFECSVIAPIPSEEDPGFQCSSMCRVGWSVAGSDLRIGENSVSVGYGSSGSLIWDDKFHEPEMGDVDGETPPVVVVSEESATYSAGDVIGSLLQWDKKPGERGLNGHILFFRNGKRIGAPVPIPSSARGKPLFPHVLLRNMRARMNLGKDAKESHPWLEDVMEEHKAHLPPLPRHGRVLCLVGVPGSGKTTYANKLVREHPGVYTILGTNHIMERMNILGMPSRGNYTRRFTALMNHAAKAFKEQLVMAGKVRRNYILDQTNVFKRARERKLGNFPDKRFGKRALVFVVTPAENAARLSRAGRESGKFVPEVALMRMHRDFHVPTGELMEVEFVQLDKKEALDVVEDQRGLAQAYFMQHPDADELEWKRRAEERKKREEAKAQAVASGGTPPPSPASPPPSMSSWNVWNHGKAAVIPQQQSSLVPTREAVAPISPLAAIPPSPVPLSFGSMTTKLRSVDSDLLETQDVPSDLLATASRHDDSLSDFTMSTPQVQLSVPTDIGVPIVKLADLEFTGTLLGRGAFGEVKEAWWQGTKVAVKRLLACPSSKQREDLVREIASLSSLRHRNILQLMAVIDDGGEMGSVTELMERGSLLSVLRSQPPPSMQWRLRWAREIASGLVFLHHRGVVHRDLKSPNVLIDESGRACLADFGMSAAMEGNSLSSQVGTPCWMAPEVIARANYAPPSDVWSFGIILHELVALRLPWPKGWNSMTLMFKIAAENVRPVVPEECPKELQNIMKRFFMEPSQRPTMIEIAKAVSAAEKEARRPGVFV